MQEISATKIPFGRLFGVLGATSLAVVMAAGTSRADIIFGTGNSDANQNIGAYVETTDTTATGQFLGGDPDVLEVETDVNLIIPANGAARVSAQSTLFTSLIWTPIGVNFEAIEFNINVANRLSGEVVLVAIDQDGGVWESDPFAVGQGQNRVWAEAINGQSIAQITIQADGAIIQDVRQVRIT